ncbi:hypothetical protein Agub_g3497 [Astrephomene gubernaculifera]|uniref:Uncharacterized protein n=1 Tax=Astrephomene gubernaculifera TaxID=47775 RepID=A0AAD3DIY2_9CHLO|nr:hypothetical protein Agub_g3497 [Astrephomene gubernaculifera]
MMQHRVLLLRALRSRLARALAQLTEAAALLRLGPGALTQLDAPAAARGAAAVGATTGLAGTAAAAADLAAAAAAGASQREQQLQAVEDAVRCAVRGMLAALQGLMHAEHHHSHQEHHQQQHQSKGDEGHASEGRQPAAAPGPGAASRPLSQELRELLDLLRLRPLAAQALQLRPGGQGAAGAAAAGTEEGRSAAGSSAAAVAAAAGGGVGVPAGVLEVTSGGGSARTALDAARRAAALSGPLVPLPSSARMPSRFQLYWLRYCTAAGVLLYGGAFLLRHSRLAGSDDLDRWILTALTAVRSALRTHVVEPLLAVRDELFRTFRDRPAIVSPQDFSVSRDSLLRMLQDFAADHKTTPLLPPSSTPPQGASASSGSSDASSTTSSSSSSSAPPPPSPSDASSSSPASTTSPSPSPAPDVPTASAASSSPTDDAALASGMSLLMRSYETELRHPLRNLLLGDLARALLIQVQGVKVDGEAAMLRMDQILRANELSLSLMAALPALGFTVAAATGLARLLIPRAPDRRREAIPSRLAMGALEVALGQLAEAEEREGQGQEAGVALEELRGLVVFRLHQVYSRVTSLYAHADRTSRYSEWRPLHADLLRLAAPAPAAQRLATHQRMMRTYTVFQR